MAISSLKITFRLAMPIHVLSALSSLGQADLISASHQKILTILAVKCLDNIVQEIGFLGEVAGKWDLNMEERKGTRDYTAEMARVASSGSYTDGLVFLWAMEESELFYKTIMVFYSNDTLATIKVYFDAWNYVHRLQLESDTKLGNDDYSNAVDNFAKNWSSLEFEEFVNELAELVDFCITPGSSAWGSAENVWKRVIELADNLETCEL
jgi:formylaminopyrimidine deformylase / aminopyrimidine aminohydrolase